MASACTLVLACGIGRAQTRATAATPPTLPMEPSVSRSSPSSIKRLIHKKPHRVASKRKHGQQKIDSDRAREIQEALIREHYLDEEPTGNWDAASQKAMERFQADNGWQTIVVPDSRALIKLGLGPDHEHLLNPETAMTSRAEPIRPPSAVVADPPPGAAPASVSSGVSNKSASPVPVSSDATGSDADPAPSAAASTAPHPASSSSGEVPAEQQPPHSDHP